MGFFDDLDDELALPADTKVAAPDVAALGQVADKLATGWRFAETITTPGKEDGEFLDQRFRIWFERGRYHYTTALVKRRGKMSEAHDETTRHLDRAGLVELLRDQPLLARKAIVAAGGTVPEIETREF